MMPMIAALALGVSLPQDQPKPALTPEQVSMRLDLLVVFALADASGKPLVIEGAIKKFGIFTSAKDAEVSLENLKKDKPEVGNKVKVVAVTLSQAYGIEQNSATTSSPMLIQFVPNDVELDAAKAELKAQGKDPTKFNGVPAFAPKLKSSGKFMTTTYAGGPVFPFFLSMADLTPFLDRARKANPASAADIVVEVTTLEGVVRNLRTSTDPSIAQIAFINTTETRAYLKANAGGGG
jgi:hypothetical protein